MYFSDSYTRVSNAQLIFPNPVVFLSVAYLTLFNSYFQSVKMGVTINDFLTFEMNR